MSSLDSPSSGFTQLAGHLDSISTTEDGSLIIKQASPLEQEFYLAMAQARAMDPDSSDSAANEEDLLQKLSRLSRFVPEFYGTLRLEGEMDVKVMGSGQSDGDSMVLKPVPPDTDSGLARESLVLENVIKPFLKPNVLDLKLGQVLYDQDASEEKKKRMHKVAQETTTGECGMRLTGFQVHSNSSTFPRPIVTHKSYGKSLRKEQLPEGIAKVFPTPSPLASRLIAETTKPESIDPICDLGLSVQTLLPILNAIHDSTTHLREVLSSLEIRIVGGSLLMVYEGDEERAQEGVRWMEKFQRSMESGNEDLMDLVIASDEDSGDSSLKSDSGSESESEDETDSAAGSKHKRKHISSPPYSIKLIDFAHTRFVPNQGPDEGVLLGLDTFLGLIKGRIEEVELARDRKDDRGEQIPISV